MTRTPFNPSLPYHTQLAGVTFVDDFESLIAGLEPGDDLMLVREPDNKHDPNAISVCLPGGTHLGYIPRDDAACAPEDLGHYSVRVNQVYHGTPDRNAGLRVTVSRDDITEEELIEAVSDVVSADDARDFIILAREAAGEPTSGACYELTSHLRIRNCILHLDSLGVDIKAVLYGDDLTAALPPGAHVRKENDLVTLYADDHHKVFDTRGQITLTGYVLRDVMATITDSEAVVASLDDLGL